MKGKSTLSAALIRTECGICATLLCLDYKERPLAATLTLTIHLFEHELHAQFTRLRVLLHSSIYTAFLVKGPTVPSSFSLSLSLLNAALCLSHLTHVPYTLPCTISYTLPATFSYLPVPPHNVRAPFELRALPRPFFRSSSWLAQLAGFTDV